MDDLRLYAFFKSISGIFGQLEGNNERVVSVMKHLLTAEGMCGCLSFAIVIFFLLTHFVGS